MDRSSRVAVNRPVGITEHGEIAVVQDFFLYRSPGNRRKGMLAGVTGSSFVPVSQEQYDEATSAEALQERLEDVWRMAVSESTEERSLEEYTQAVIDTGEAEDVAFDQSYSEHWDALRAIDGMADVVLFDCTGGGRMFSSSLEFATVLDADLLALVRRAESGLLGPRQYDALLAEVRAYVAALAE